MVLGFDYTSNLVDLLLSPHGSSPLYQSLVPRQYQDQSVQDRMTELECHLVSHGLNQDSMRMLTETGVRSLSLLALLRPRDIQRLFPAMTPQQRRLLEVSLARLDPRPPYQVTAGLKRFLAHSPAEPGVTEEVEEKPSAEEQKEQEHKGGEVDAALKLVESSKKILECPVCYLTCLPPRIWQCNNGHLTCNSCHAHTRLCPLCRSNFTAVRPLAAERLAAQVPTPCRNAAHGCRVSLAWADRQRHEAECELGVGHCPVISCSAPVSLRGVVEHLKLVHSWSEDFIHHKLDDSVHSFSSSISTANFLHTMQDQQNFWWGPQSVSYEGQLFFLLISRHVADGTDRGYFNFWLWMAGTEARAGTFRYRIQVEGAGEEISYASAPVSLEVGLVTIREEQLSLLLSDGAVRRLIRNGDRLHYNVQIEKC